MLHGVAWISGKERSDMSETLRRLVWLGLERDLAERYRRGEVSVREAAGILRRSVRDTLEVFWEMGVAGNVTAAQALRAVRAIGRQDELRRSARSKGRAPRRTG